MTVNASAPLGPTLHPAPAALEPTVATQPLPTFCTAAATRTWLAAIPAEPRRRHARDTASLAVTTELPVIGRAGTRERVRSGNAVFGGGEVRS